MAYKYKDFSLVSVRLIDPIPVMRRTTEFWAFFSKEIVNYSEVMEYYTLDHNAQTRNLAKTTSSDQKLEHYGNDEFYFPIG